MRDKYVNLFKSTVVAPAAAQVSRLPWPGNLVLPNSNSSAFKMMTSELSVSNTFFLSQNYNAL